MSKFIPAGPKRYAHQIRGLRKMIETRGVCALLYSPGTGKTAATLDYCSLLALKSPTREARVLVICPLAAIDTWVIQAEEYISPQVNYWAEAVGGSLKERGQILPARGGKPLRGQHSDHLVNRALTLNYRGDHEEVRSPKYLGSSKPKLTLLSMNFDSFSSRARIGSRTMADYMLAAVERFNPDLVVIDESHKIKSPSSNVSNLMARIGKRVQRRIILTGTVMPKSPMDIYGQWRFLEPKAFGQLDSKGKRKDMTLDSFQNQFVLRGGFMGKEIKGFRNLDRLQDIMAKNAVVATKEDSLDLPKTTDVIVPVHLSQTEQVAYAAMRKHLKATLSHDSEATAVNKLTRMIRLRQITSGHIPDDSGEMKILGKSRVKVIKSLIEDTLHDEKRIVIFAQFTQEIDMLMQELPRKGTEVLKISGGVKSDDRIKIRKRFGSDEDTRMVLVTQISTISLAVNELVTANHAIFASLSLKRDDLIQGRDRLYRIGQTKPCTFWYALAPGTVDEVIYKSHQERTDLEKAMLQHIFENENES